MTNYKCSINDYSAEIDAQSPSEAARKCVEKRMREFSWFANQSPELASVVVDGVTFEPKSVSDSANTWDFRYELSHELCHFEFAGSVVEPPSQT